MHIIPEKDSSNSVKSLDDFKIKLVNCQIFLHTQETAETKDE